MAVRVRSQCPVLPVLVVEMALAKAPSQDSAGYSLAVDIPT
jgi:hypothetical protein